MERTLFIHATNVHQGGGRYLLEGIFNSLPTGIKLILSLDSRMPLPVGIKKEVQVKRVEPSIVRRILAEKWLADNVVSGSVVLCFGNLPPLFKLRGHTVVFVQNRYLIDDAKLNGFPLVVQLRLVIERLWFSSKMSNASEFIVQTPTMKKLLEIKTQRRVPVRVLPFVSDPKVYSRGVLSLKVEKENEFDFLYVATGEPHKNHRRLIEAWCLLAKEGLFPSLCLTLDDARFAVLCKEIEAMHQQHGLKVENAGWLSHNEVLSLYKKAGASIYPSTLESLGLPLIEARQAGLAVLASELDFVRDVLDPEHTFDPESAVSIARAVKRYLGLKEEPLPLQDATKFIEHLLEGEK